MPVYEHYHDTVQWHLSDITSRIIAESGIPSDRFHLGKVILQSLRDNPGLVAQIEGTSGESETNGSLVQRTIQCAIGLKKLGLKTGDVLIIMGPNHLDIGVPFYAALYLGIIVAPIDRFLGVNELIHTFTVTKPSIVFCQSEKVEDIRETLQQIELKAKVVTFDKGDGDFNFSELLRGEAEEVDKFRPTDLDPAETIAMLISTSGTTGLPKNAAITHKNFMIMAPYLWTRTVEIPSYKSALVVSPLQWLTAIRLYICAPYMQYTRILTVQKETQEHIYELINKYKPALMILSPTLMLTLVKPGERDKCDFTCLERIMVGGSAVYPDLLEQIKKISPKTDAICSYGMSEITTMAFQHGFSSPPTSCGKPIGGLQYRLVDVETGRNINEPNAKGELWLKSPGLFKGYYNNPEATKESFEGEWFKTGDLFYRDENWNFYFAERIKLLLKYNSYQISPVELEAVIHQHPGVLDAAVTGVPDATCGELPVACVVRAPDHNVTAQEIKDLVKESLSETKQLRGGVIFIEQLPLTPSSKVDRKKIKEMALNMKRE